MKKRTILFFTLGVLNGLLVMQKVMGIQTDVRPFLFVALVSFVLLIRGQKIIAFTLGLVLGFLIVPWHLSLWTMDKWDIEVVTGIRGLVISQDPMTERGIIKTSALSYAGEWDERQLKVVCYGLSGVGIGDEVEIMGNLNPVKQSQNLYGFDGRQYYASQGIKGIFYSRLARARVIAPGFGFETAFLKLRANWISAIDDNSNYGGYWTAFILGEDGGMTDEAMALIRRSGLAHVLAVSGLHIGIIYSCLAFVSHHLLHKKWQQDCLIFTVLFVYASFNLWSFTVCRALLLLVYHRICFYNARRPDMITGISIIACVSFMVNSFCVYDLSFSLSLSAALSIALFYTPIKAKINWMGQSFSSALGLIIAAQLGVLPLQLYTFNVFYPESLLFNLLFVPVLSVVIGLAFILSVASLIPFLLPVTTALFDGLMGPVENTLWRVGELFQFPIYLTGFQVVVVLILGVISVVFCTKFDLHQKKQVAGFGLLAFLILCYTCYTPFKLIFWSTGKSDAILIKHEGKGVLIDSGDGKMDVGLMMLKNDIKHLEAMVITHDDRDHTGGVEAILRCISIKERIEGVEGINALDCGDLHLDFYYGDDDVTDNNGSVITYLKHNSFTALFMGDAEISREYLFLKIFPYQIDLLKVGHHGSKSSTSDDFLKQLAPRIAVILCDGSKYFPNEEVLERLYDCGILVYRTDQSGCVEVTESQENIRIKTYLRSDNEL